MNKQPPNRRVKPKAAKGMPIDTPSPARRNAVNLLDLAYERFEHLIVTCELKPGAFLTIQDLQDMSGFSRTPRVRPTILWPKATCPRGSF